MADLSIRRYVRLECGHELTSTKSRKASCNKCRQDYHRDVFRYITEEYFEDRWVSWHFAKYQRILKDLKHGKANEYDNCVLLYQTYILNGMSEIEACEKIFVLYEEMQKASNATKKAKKKDRMVIEGLSLKFFQEDGYSSPDDTRYKPKYIDPLLRGPGRVTGMTAKAVKRQRTMNKFEHDS